jgi:hypothetical protein
MPTVDRIESTAEKTDIHESLVSSFAGSIGKSTVQERRSVSVPVLRDVQGHWPIVHRQGCLFGREVADEETVIPGIRNELL